MLLCLENQSRVPEFLRACAFERVFGSKCRTALQARGPESGRFYLALSGESPAAALWLEEGVLTVSASPQADPEEIAALARREKVREIDAGLALCQALRQRLGGRMESSWFMAYEHPAPPEGPCPAMSPGRLPEVYGVLRRSHAYYRAHLEYGSWSAGWERRLSLGLSELWQLELDGEVVGTGSIASWDEDTGVLAAVAVVPERRHQGLGAGISRFLTRRVLEQGKTPRLIAGYDEIAELYRQVGFTERGRWGELYLNE